MSSERASSTCRKRRLSCTSSLLMWTVLLVLLSTGAAMEATWTPNPEDDGPLPLSQAQRQQLLQLEQTIMQSPDPQGTLTQVAEANGMQPQELLNMLERNRSDMGGAVGASSSRAVKAWPQAILKLISSLGVLLSQNARRNPKTFALATTALLLVVHVLFAAPRTGLVLSSGSGLLSSGHSTLWNPPQKYIAKCIDSKRFSDKTISLPGKVKSLTWDELPQYLDEDDGVEIHKMTRKSSLAQAVTAQRTINVDFYASMLAQEEDKKDADDEDATVDQQEEVLDLMYDAAASVLWSRRLTEFVDPPKSLRLQASQETRKRSAILIVRKLGNWGSYGLQPLQVVQQQEGPNAASLTYSTLQGGHFDGQIYIRAKKGKDKLVIQVRLLVPKKGRKINKNLASNVADALAQSIARSVTTQTRQTLARRSQGKHYRDNSKVRAAERRHIRSENERKQEEMAVDRRRKWQRQNPDAGRYRPSGDRMRSPNNC